MAATQDLHQTPPAHTEIVDETDADRLARQHELYGGLRWRGAFCGWCTSLGVTTLLAFLVAAAAAAFRYWQGPGAFTRNGLVVALVAAACVVVGLAVSYYAGGYVAGRMARFDGGLQGLGVWVWGVAMSLLIAGGAVLFVVAYNLYASMTLPRVPLNSTELEIAGGAVLAISALAMLAAAAIGGRVAVRRHRKMDAAS